MKFVLAALAGLTLSLGAFADILTERTGNYVCGRITDSSAATCFDIIAGQYVDQLAAGACDRFRSAKDTLDCMRTIVGREFENVAVRSCDRFNGASDTINCLRTVGGRRFQESAAKACDRFNGANDTISCLDTIADKSYDEQTVRDCDANSTAAGTLACFRNNGWLSRGQSQVQNPAPGGLGGETCWVKQAGRYLTGDEFYNFASQAASKNRQCVIANIARQSFSHRIYDIDGSRIAKSAGGLSNSQVDQHVDARYCQKVTCEVQ